MQYYKPTRSNPLHGGTVRESSFAQSTAASTNPQVTSTGKHPRYGYTDAWRDYETLASQQKPITFMHVADDYI